MALPTTSNWFKIWLQDCLKVATTGGTIDLNPATTADFKLALYLDSGTYTGQNFDTDTYYNVGAWVATNEKTTAGGYTQGGQVFSAVTTLSVSAANTLTWGVGATTSWGGSTIAAEGCVVYATVPTNKYLMTFNKFAGAPSSVGGTFSVTYSSGILSWT
jgi:hypothetical protein